MEEVFEQTGKMMEKMWEPWHKMMAEPPWLKKADLSLMGKWSPWISTMRSTYETNMSVWDSLSQQTEEFLVKMYKDSPQYSEAAEGQIREVWNSIKNANKTQRDFVMENLQKLESMLKEKEGGE